MSIEVMPAAGTADLSEFCQEHLSSLSRSDQRRWGEVYVRGLVSVPGRKSIKRICDHVVGWRADQCLQQFINQSTWRWEPVRCGLAHAVHELIRPRAWAITEAVFPKNGSSSVGVARQYAPSAGRVLNCQLGLAVSLIGDDGSCPVNWRLLLPPSWDDDPGRRARTHLPHAQRHRPRWRDTLDAVEELALGWRVPPAPVLMDATDVPDIEFLLRDLEKRGLPYLVRVPAHTSNGRPGATATTWRPLEEPLARFVATPVPGTVRRARLLITKWIMGRGRPEAVWLTNRNLPLPELVGLMSLRAKAAEDLEGLRDRVGLGHFEGRSYRGWHHHVTLASVAGAYQLVNRLECAP